MATVEKRPLTGEEVQEAARLMAAWKAYKDANPGATQGWLGSATELGSQGLIGQYLRGIIPLNVKALLAICRQIDADPKKISPRLTRDLEAGGRELPLDGPDSGQRRAIDEMIKAIQQKVGSEEDFRILMQVILDQDPAEIPDHIRDSVKSMVRTLRNLIQQSAQRN